MISDPFFLPTPLGRLFAVHHRPARSTRLRGNVLCAQAFNEEMNRCRSMVTQQAQAFAAIGFGTLVLDLLGTGDSEGEFVDGRWSLWLDNLAAGMAWLDEQPGGCRAVWGIRLGALLAVQLHERLARPDLALVLWQPVTDGKTHLTQFFRVRIAAGLDRPGGPKETTAGMREQLASGQPLEVAGYEIHPELAAAIDGTRLDQVQLLPGVQVLWLENAPEDKLELSPNSQAVLGRWPAVPAEVQRQVYAGPAFWQVYERVLAPAAVTQTTSWLDVHCKAS